MNLVLHHCHQSRSLRTQWLLEEIGLPYDLVVHDFGGALQAPDYLGLSPAGRVPCLLRDGQPMTESGAIAEVLCEETGSPLGRPPGTTERADWLQWLHFAETIGQHLAALTQQHIVLFEEARSVGVMKLERRRLEKTLAVVARAVADRPYLLPGGFSAVDINVGYGVILAGRFTDLGAQPGAAAYAARLAARPAYQACLPPPGAACIYTRDFYDLPGP